MAYYHPCRGCRKSASKCQRREEIRNAISGLHVTSVKFRCDQRLPEFSAGDRVAISWRVFGGFDYYGDIDEAKAVFHGTIGYEIRPARFVVRVDPGECVSIEGDWDHVTAETTFKNDSLIVAVKLRDLTALDEPRRRICAACMGLDGDDRCEGYGKSGTWDSYWPSECIKKPN